jgi:hypothetical protein
VLPQGLLHTFSTRTGLAHVRFRAKFILAKVLGELLRKVEAGENQQSPANRARGEQVPKQTLPARTVDKGLNEVIAAAVLKKIPYTNTFMISHFGFTRDNPLPGGVD